MRIALTAAYPRSLHSIALLHELHARGHEVTMLLEPKISVARMKTYLRMLGPAKLGRKILARIDPAGRGEEVRPMRDYLREHRITSSTTAQACKALRVRHLRINDLNDERGIAALRDAQIDLIVYAGGGIVRAPLIQASRLGVLNAHGGPLPEIRGMNAGEWALFFGKEPAVTTHFIDTGIDTGPILLSRKVTGWKNIPQMRGISAKVGVELLLETVDKLADGVLEPLPQAVADGNQYYSMASPLIEIVDQWLRQRKTPQIGRAHLAKRQRER